MAADKIVKSFLILFPLFCLLRYGSCAPVINQVTLDNGTVLTMVMHDAQRAPPPPSDSSLDASTGSNDGPVIVIHDVHYAPPPRRMPRRMSKRDADAVQVVDDPVTPAPPLAIDEKDSARSSTPGVVADGAPTTKAEPKADSNETVNTKSGTTKVSEGPPSAIQGADVDQANNGDADHKADEVVNSKEQERTTTIAIQSKSSSKAVEGGSADGGKAEGDGTSVAGDAGKDSVEGGDDEVKPERTTPAVALPTASIDKPNDAGSPDEDNTEGDTEEVDAGDQEDADGEKDEEDENAQNDDELPSEPNLNTPSGEGTGLKPSPDNGDQTIIDKPPVATQPSDVGTGGEPNGEETADDQIGDSVNDDHGTDGEDDDDDDDYEGTEDDNNKISQDAEENIQFEETAEPDDEPDDEPDTEELDEQYSKGKPESSGEINEPERTSKKDASESQSSGHFMSYFLIAVVCVACFYLVFHNRQKIKAFVLEGKTGRGRKRKAGNSEYRQLSTAEEVLPSPDKAVDSKITYTY